MIETDDTTQIGKAQIETHIQFEDTEHSGEGQRIICQTTQVRAVFGLHGGRAKLNSIEPEGALMLEHDTRDLKLINRRVQQCDQVEEIFTLRDYLEDV